MQSLPVSKSAGGFKSASRFRVSHQIYQSANLPAEMEGNLLADLVTVTKSASRSMQSLQVSKYTGVFKSASRFRDCHQICQSANLPAEMWGEGNMLADLVTVTKSASRSMQSLQVSIYTGGNLPADLVTVINLPVSKSASRKGVKSAGRFTPPHFCLHIW